MARARILVADDDREIVELIKAYLVNEGYEVICAYDGTACMRALEEEQVELLVLDIMMPGMDGMEVLRRLRQRMTLPVIFVSAKSTPMDKIMGLATGADDYLTKPFHPMELVARIKAQLRRASQFGRPSGIEEIILKDLVLNITQHRLTQNEREIRLTPKEFGILEMLMRHPGRVFSSEQIFEAVWGEKAYDQDNTVMVHIRKLRDKLRDDSRRPRYIRTVWGVGYSFEK